MPDIAAPMDRSMGVRRLAAPFLALLLSFFPALAGAFDTSLFIDPEDGMFDASRYLSERRFSFLPVPVVITEPAVGPGFGVVGVFFHESPEQREAAARLAERGELTRSRPCCGVVQCAVRCGQSEYGGGRFSLPAGQALRDCDGSRRGPGPGRYRVLHPGRARLVDASPDRAGLLQSVYT